MGNRVTFLAGFAAGFVVGTRAGRERYEQMVKLSRKAVEHPAVQQAGRTAGSKANDLTNLARQKATERFPKLAETAGIGASRSTTGTGQAASTAGTSSGTAGTSSGTAGTSSGTAGTSSGTAGTSSGTAGTSGSTAGSKGAGTSGRTAGTKGAGTSDSSLNQATDRNSSDDGSPAGNGNRRDE